jgi:hypothetical protein
VIRKQFDSVGYSAANTPFEAHAIAAIDQRPLAHVGGWLG